MISQKIHKSVFVVKSIGVLLLLFGLVFLFLIPAEFTSFYAFSEGGNFHYIGFGFGSLMFTFIIFNILLYFVLAALCIPLGLGNLKRTPWGYSVTLAVLKILLITGTAGIVSLLLSFDLYRAFEVYKILLVVLAVFLGFMVIPFFLMRFYKKEETKKVFSLSGGVPNNLDGSSNKAAIMVMNFLWILVFYLCICSQGVFPLFGTFILLRKGTYALSAAIFILCILTYLFYSERKSIKVGMVLFYLLLLCTFAYTFMAKGLTDVWGLLNLPLYEREKVLPAFSFPANINLGVFFGILIMFQIFLVIRTKPKRRS